MKKTIKKNQMNSISKIMKKHYEATFQHHGPTSAGVDWGKDKSKTILRYKKMLAVLGEEISKAPSSLLDVGCGYGGLQDYAQKTGINLEYSGIDIASNMIKWAKKNIELAEFIEGDFLKIDFTSRKFDYVVCNGILTQKLTASIPDMDKYAKELIHKMFDLCNKAIAFNMMSTQVNFFAQNLYYKHPAEILTWCLSEVSKKVKIDHSYGLYEFTVYLYK